MRWLGSDARLQGAGEPDDSPRERQAARRTGAAQGQRGYPRLRLHERFLPLLVGVTLISTFGLASLAYLGARADAISSAQGRALQDVQVERQLLSDQGTAINLTDGNLTVGVDNAAAQLNGDPTLVDRTRSIVGAYATIYALQGPSLIAIATNLPQADGSGRAISGSRALGDSIPDAAYTALLGGCGPTDSADCHHEYSGVVSIHGISYVAGFAPLYDMSGSFVGALGAAVPLNTVVAPTVQLAVVLLLVGLLVALGGLVTGFWLFGSLSRNVLETLDAGLATIAESAGEVERLAHAQVERAGRDSRTAIQVSEQARALDGLAGALNQGHGALQESAGGIWAEMSQPGIAPNAGLAMRWAQQAAIAAGKVGGSAAEARDRCRQLVTLMNHILAESTVASESGDDVERHARILRESVERVEQALGKRLISRQFRLSLPLLRKSGRRSTLRQDAGRADAAGSAGTSRQQAIRMPRTGGSGAFPARQTGAVPAVRPDQLSGRNPYATGKFPAVPRPGSQSGRPPIPGPSHKGRFAQPGNWSMPPSSGINSQRRRPRPSTPLGNTGRHGSAGNDLGLPGLPEEYRSSWKLDDEGDSDAADWPNEQQ